MVKTAATVTALVSALVASAELDAQSVYNDANSAYRAREYAKAVELYRSVIEADAESKEIQPAYFFLANALDNLYDPSKRGDAANDALLDNAVKYYRLAADRLNTSDNTEYKKLGKISLQYLVSAYGSDKLNDPAKAEQLLQEMIQREPGDMANYFTLARLYEDANAYDNAERVLVTAKNAQSNNNAASKVLTAFYTRHPEMKK